MDILQKKMEYLIFDHSVDKNKDLLKKDADVWDRIKNKIKPIKGGKKMIAEKTT